MMEEMGLPFAYDHFVEGRRRSRRLRCFCIPGRIIFRRTGFAYFKKNELDIELLYGLEGPGAGRGCEAVLLKARDFLREERGVD